MDEREGGSVARTLGGDREAFRALVEQHSRYLYGLAHRLTGNAQDAEDVVQDSWLKAHRQMSRFEARSDVRTWLHRIVVNSAIDLMRKRRHLEETHDPTDLVTGPLSALGSERQPTPERTAASGEIAERVHAALRLLTPLERAAFTLRHMEGLSIDEIGERLGTKTSATKHGIFRAVRKMRQALEPFVQT